MDEIRQFNPTAADNLYLQDNMKKDLFASGAKFDSRRPIMLTSQWNFCGKK